MTDQRPSQITQEHLNKGARVYVRQSTGRQVRDNTGSTDHQRNQKAYALRWGWRDDQIELYEDLGVSGTSTDGRDAFQRLLRDIGEGRVGAVFCANAARLSRAPLDFEMLVNLCRYHRTLFVIEGQVLDLNNAANRLLARLQGGVAEYENDMRIQNSVNGKYTKAKDGKAVSRPPTGYVVSEKGKWVKDQDQAVRECLDNVFQLFDRLGSVPQVLRHLARTGAKIPVRTFHGELSWVRPNLSRLYSILTHPAYAGHYTLGRRRSTPDRFGKSPRLTPPNEWTMVLHHEGYITPTAWLRNCERLRRNCRVAKSPVGKGVALCQGLLRCGRCDRFMGTTYTGKRNGRTWTTYRCDRAYHMYGDPSCYNVSGQALDRAVSAELLRSLQPPDLEAVLEAGREVNQEYEAARRQRDRKLADAQYQVRLATKRYEAVDPENRRVCAALEKDREQAIKNLEEVEFRHRQEFHAPPLALTPEEVSAIYSAAQDLPQLWSASTTTPQDWKELLRMMVQQIRLMTILPAYYVVEIDWVGGATTSHRIARSRKAALVALELKAQGLRRQAIAEELNRLGFTRDRGEPFTARAVTYYCCNAARRTVADGVATQYHERATTMTQSTARHGLA